MPKRIRHRIAHQGKASGKAYPHLQGKPQNPRDLPITQMKEATREHNGTELGTRSPVPSYGSIPPMIDYPDQEIGA